MLQTVQKRVPTICRVVHIVHIFFITIIYIFLFARFIPI